MSGDDIERLRDRLAGPDGIAAVERMLNSPSPPVIRRGFGAEDVPVSIAAALTRGWMETSPGVKVPVVKRREVELSAGSYCEGPEYLTPAQALATAAALIAAAYWVESQ